MKKMFSCVVAACMAAFIFVGCGRTAVAEAPAQAVSSSETVSSSSVEESNANENENAAVTAAANASGETATQSEAGGEQAAAELMQALNGTYEELWPVILQSKYDELWLEDCKAIVGDESAAEAAEMMKTACSGTVIGQEAVDLYQGKDAYYFDCDFTQNVAQFAFEDGVITGVDANGAELFSHSYRFLQYDENMGFYVYQSEDANAGEFTYFAMAADTPATTQHIEFRYGDDVEALSQYDSGDYAYWMAAGIPVDSDDDFIAQCINLFCTENLQG